MVWLIRCPLNLHLQPSRTPLSSAKYSTELHSPSHHTDISQNPPELRQQVWSFKLRVKSSVEVDIFYLVPNTRVRKSLNFIALMKTIWLGFKQYWCDSNVVPFWVLPFSADLAGEGGSSDGGDWCGTFSHLEPKTSADDQEGWYCHTPTLRITEIRKAFVCRLGNKIFIKHINKLAKV